MSFSVGIVGLPNVGKSTLFKALTKQKVKIAPHPFTTIEPNIGKVWVPDERLKAISKITNPEKVTPTTIEFVDIAGLVKGAWEGEGLGNQFLAQIRNCNAIVQVIRVFKDEKVQHVEKEINPKRDLEIIELELIMKDLETTERALTKLKESKKLEDKEKIKRLILLEKIKKALSQGKKISTLFFTEKENLLIKEFNFLTQKPIIYLFNISAKESFKIDEELKSKIGNSYIIIDLKLEEEISELSLKEREELKIESLLDQFILACYNALDLITFFTILGKETKAWTIKRGTKALQGAGKVHSDFEKNFIKAEVINWEKLVKAGSWKKAKQSGLIEIVGKDYVIKDGDVIEFKI
jgi:hypothetical protein